MHNTNQSLKTSALNEIIDFTFCQIYRVLKLWDWSFISKQKPVFFNLKINHFFASIWQILCMEWVLEH